MSSPQKQKWLRNTCNHR